MRDCLGRMHVDQMVGYVAKIAITSTFSSPLVLGGPIFVLVVFRNPRVATPHFDMGVVGELHHDRIRKRLWNWAIRGGGVQEGRPASSDHFSFQSLYDPVTAYSAGMYITLEAAVAATVEARVGAWVRAKVAVTSALMGREHML